MVTRSFNKSRNLTTFCKTSRFSFSKGWHSLRTADVFPVVASLPPKNNAGREAMTGNTSAVHRLGLACLWQQTSTQTSQKSPPPTPKLKPLMKDILQRGIEWYNVCKKNVGLRKFWPGLKISDAFLIGLKVLFQVIFLHLVVSNFFADRSRNC